MIIKLNKQEAIDFVTSQFYVYNIPTQISEEVECTTPYISRNGYPRFFLYSKTGRILKTIRSKYSTKTQVLVSYKRLNFKAHCTDVRLTKAHGKWNYAITIIPDFRAFYKYNKRLITTIEKALQPNQEILHYECNELEPTQCPGCMFDSALSLFNARIYNMLKQDTETWLNMIEGYHND